MATSTIKRKVASINGVQVFGAKTSADLKFFNTSYSASQDVTSTANNTNYYWCKLTLPAGAYLVEMFAGFRANATGVRRTALCYGSSHTEWNYTVRNQPAVSSGWGYVRYFTTIVITEQTDVYLKLLQNSGSAVDCSASLNAWKI